MSEPRASPAGLRVLIVGLNYRPEPTGIAPYTTGLAEDLAARGHAVEVVAGRPYYPQWRAYDGFRVGWQRTVENGVGIVRCPHYVPRRPTGPRRILHHLSFVAAALPVIVTLAVRRRPDIVLCIAPSIVSAAAAWLGARLGRAKFWLHVQDFEVDASFATGLVSGGSLAGILLAAERSVLRHADVVSSISPAMVAGLMGKGVDPARTYELRNWANLGPQPGNSEVYRCEWGLAGRKVALYAGSIGRKQGAGLLLEAAARLTQRNDIAFVICGEGPGLAELKAAAKGLANVRFEPLQPADRLADLLALADMHLLPQLSGAADLVLPSKLTNMLHSGRPVVATAEPGTGLHDEIAGCGIAVPPGDPQTLAAAVVRLADDLDLAAQLGAAASRRATERWSKQAILAGFEKRLVETARRPASPTDYAGKPAA